MIAAGDSEGFDGGTGKIGRQGAWEGFMKGWLGGEINTETIIARFG